MSTNAHLMKNSIKYTRPMLSNYFFLLPHQNLTVNKNLIKKYSTSINERLNFIEMECSDEPISDAKK